MARSLIYTYNPTGGAVAAGTGADQGVMVGNSLKSDVLPMLEAGGWGVHVPHGLTWALERADPPPDAAGSTAPEQTGRDSDGPPS